MIGSQSFSSLSFICLPSHIEPASSQTPRPEQKVTRNVECICANGNAHRFVQSSRQIMILANGCSADDIVVANAALAIFNFQTHHTNEASLMPSIWPVPSLRASKCQAASAEPNPSSATSAQFAFIELSPFHLSSSILLSVVFAMARHSPE